ncbi:DUF4123 domain-containing protein [Gloeobacter kilaueensis]|uniref:DUF4123 domain-containing protein n=1 Tax=Gloeobacter kilaueensis (strain ATCC BAA-2537 / CCAP 1431/1 / ULC 316 / JS1) TaxID=1183438 RepID=U5QQ20_GLOK1|nr:DUF4123 domain-containing protein [Gloeobacter kilaueensis]AGY59790.1 hypothetical protein GKIL_3544 [Gloeobacter kilaueensis JS1]
MSNEPRLPPSSARKVRQQLSEAVERLPGAWLYALLDAARHPDILTGIESYTSSHLAERACLYRGEAESTLARCAPYLVRVRLESALLQWLTQAWGASWGVYLISTAPLEQLRTHFRKFLLVEDTQGKQLYFRFYDPRVLRLFLPACNAEELQRFYGPVASFLMEDGRSEKILHFAGDERTAQQGTERTKAERAFRIRQEHESAFYSLAEAAFVEKLLKHLRTHHEGSVSTLSDTELKSRVRFGLQQARRYGITWESSLTAFVGLMFEFAPNFDEHTRIKAVLNDPAIHPNRRVRALIGRTTVQDWQEVQERSDHWHRLSRGS